ncbi:MAG: hypothetical protein HC858_11770 [Brachymonas sp.]|nr:hypothetical protein [Brachymonas sp.]
MTKAANRQSNIRTPKDRNRGGSGDVDLDFGEGKATQMWRSQAALALKRVDLQQRQAVLDEWIARMESNDMKPIRMPLKFLDTLISSARAGQFRPEMGHAVAQARKFKNRSAALQQGMHIAVVTESSTKKPEEEFKPPSAETQALVEALKLRLKSKLPLKSSNVEITKPANRVSQVEAGHSVDSPRPQAGQAEVEVWEAPTLQSEVPRPQAGQADSAKRSLWKFLRAEVSAVANSGAGTAL